VPRQRFGVVLLVPEPLATEIDGVRRALGDGSLGRVPAHLTLVPPVNVRVQDVPAALAVLRDAAAQTHPIWVRLGPPATFLPATPTVHLEVHSPHTVRPDGGRINRLEHPLLHLRSLVFRSPLERTLTFPFVAHVTLCDGAPERRIRAAVEALGGFEHDVCFERVHLLEEQRGDDGVRRWIPVADVPLAPRTIVGRGGVELELTPSTLVDPEAAAFEAAHRQDGAVRAVTRLEPAGARPLVVTARRHGVLVGLAVGWTRDGAADMTSTVVHPEHRRQGVALQLARAFHAEALARDEPPGT
jgi:ribosomal protein S18 acetylase RimI-like enzyme